MATNEVKYRITADDKSKPAIDSAKNNLSQLDSTAKAVSNALKIAFAKISFDFIKKGIEDVTKFFGVQEQAEKRLATSISNNPYLNGKTFESLTRKASEFQSLSIFGDEQIIQMQSYLASLGLSEKKINDVMQASINLASTGMFSLEGAVKNISKTFAGMTGELGEAIPSLKSLTQEQLKAGGAVELLNKQFQGMGESLTKTFAGRTQQIQNLVGDIKEKIGGAFAQVGLRIYDVMQPALEKVLNYFDTNKTRIYAVFASLPEIILKTGQLISDVLRTAFSPSNVITTLTETASLFGSLLLTSIKSAITTIPNLLASIAGSIGKYIGGVLITDLDKKIKDLETKIANTNYSDRSKFGVTGELSRIDDIKQLEELKKKKQEYNKEMEKAVNMENEYIQKVKESISKTAEEYKKNFINAYPELKKEMIPLFDNFQKTINDLIKSNEQIITSQENLKREIKNNTISQPNSNIKLTPAGNIISAPNASSFDNSPSNIIGLILKDLKDSFSDKIKNIASGIGDAFESLGSELGSAILNIKSLSAVLNWQKTITYGFIKIIEPALNTILKPIVGALVILGETLGKILVPVLTAMSPLIKGLGEAFAWLYNTILLPVGNALGIVLGTVYNMFADFYNFIKPVLELLQKGFAIVGNLLVDVGNAILSAYEAITFWDETVYDRATKTNVDELSLADLPKMNLATSLLSPINYGSLLNAGEQYYNENSIGVSSSGAPAEYTKPRDIVIYQNIEPGAYIVGQEGMRDFAKMIKQELLALNVLGL